MGKVNRRQRVLAPEQPSISSHWRQKGGDGGYGRPYGRFSDPIGEGAVAATGFRLGASLAAVIRGKPLIGFLLHFFSTKKVEKKNLPDQKTLHNIYTARP